MNYLVKGNELLFYTYYKIFDNNLFLIEIKKKTIFNTYLYEKFVDNLKIYLELFNKCKLINIVNYKYFIFVFNYLYVENKSFSPDLLHNIILKYKAKTNEDLDIYQLYMYFRFFEKNYDYIFDINKINIIETINFKHNKFQKFKIKNTIEELNKNYHIYFTENYYIFYFNEKLYTPFNIVFNNVIKLTANNIEINKFVFYILQNLKRTCEHINNNILHFSINHFKNKMDVFYIYTKF